jgi:GAF domain-containing protein
VGDAQADPSWLANPLLPATRSEMAVPIMLEANVVGVLDVQSDQVNGLTEVDQATLQVLADQIAIAVRNANLFAEVRQKLDEAERLQRLYVSQAWQQLRITQERTHFEVGYPTLTDEGVPEVDAVLQQGRTVDLKIPTTALEANGHGSDQGQGDDKTRRALATPLKLHNQIVGVLGIQDENPDRQWTEDEIALIESVSEQMSLAIENARLFDETRRNAWRDQVVSESTAKIWSSDEVEAVMKVAVAQLADKLHASEVVLRLGSEEELT